MQARSTIARCARSNTNLVCFYTAVNSFTAALAFAFHSVAYVFCKRPTVERTQWINVSHLYILCRFKSTGSRIQLSVRSIPPCGYGNIHDRSKNQLHFFRLRNYCRWSADPNPACWFPLKQLHHVFCVSCENKAVSVKILSADCDSMCLGRKDA